MIDRQTDRLIDKWKERQTYRTYKYSLPEYSVRTVTTVWLGILQWPGTKNRQTCEPPLGGRSRQEMTWFNKRLAVDSYRTTRKKDQKKIHQTPSNPPTQRLHAHIFHKQARNPGMSFEWDP